MAPGVEEQMQSSAKMGAGVGQAMEQQGKNPLETLVSTVEKLLMGSQDETFQTYAKKAIATLKVGLGMAAQKQPQSSMAPPQPGAGQSGPGANSGLANIPAPPVPGQMPG